jgi:phage repressor protein C with HTH and peptisase S24 domain
MNTVQERLRIIRKNIGGLSQDELAIKTGSKRTTIAGYEAGVSLPHAEFLTALNKNYGINSNWLLTGEGDMFIKSSSESEKEITPVGHQIPVLRQKVSCGKGQNWDDETNIERYVNVFDIIPHLRTGKVYAVPVSGSSMLGVGIRDGDIVLFDAAKSQDTNDGIYVFSLDGDVFCKRLEFDALTKQIKVFSVRVADLEKAELAMSFKADDPALSERLTIFGRVHAWIHPDD